MTYAVRIPKTGSFNGDMEIMHLDTFFMPLTENRAIGCHEILSQCLVMDMPLGDKTTIPFFMEHLMVNADYLVLDMPKEEQKNYAANLRVIKPGTVIVPSDYNPVTTQTLKGEKINFYSAKLSHLTNAVCATHCMFLPLEQHL